MKTSIILGLSLMIIAPATNSFAEGDKIKSTYTKEAEQAAAKEAKDLKAEVAQEDEADSSAEEGDEESDEAAEE